MMKPRSRVAWVIIALVSAPWSGLASARVHAPSDSMLAELQPPDAPAAPNKPGRVPINPATGKPYTVEELKVLSANMRKFAESPLTRGNNYIITRAEHAYSRFSLGGQMGDELMLDQPPAIYLNGQAYLNCESYMEAVGQVAEFAGRHAGLFSQASASADNGFDFNKPIDDKAMEQAQKNLDLFTAYELRMERILAETAPLFRSKLPIVSQIVALDKAISRANYLQQSSESMEQQKRQLQEQLKPIDAQIAAKVAPIKAMAERDLFGPNAKPPLEIKPEEKKESKVVSVRFLTKGPSGWRQGTSTLLLGAPTIAEVRFDNDPGDDVPPLVVTVGGKKLELPLKLAQPESGAAAGGKVFRSGVFLPWPGESDDGGLGLPPPTR